MLKMVRLYLNLFCFFYKNGIMKLSVVIPTRGDQNMRNTIECLEKQTFKDFEVIFVVDKILEKKEAEFEDK